MKIYLFFISVVFSLSCLAQKRVVVKDLVSVNIPYESNIVSKTNLMETNSKKNGRNVVNDLIKRADARYLYSIKGTSFYLNADNNPVKKDHLNVLKDGFDEMAKGLKNYNSKIISNGNKSMLLINNGQITTMYIYDNVFSKSLTGLFIVKEGQDVTKLVNQIYNSVNFNVDGVK